MNDHRAQSWQDLLDQLYAESWKAPLGRFRSNFAFRGMALAEPPPQREPAGNGAARRIVARR